MPSFYPYPLYGYQFSGVCSQKDAEILQSAGVKNILVDPFDFKYIANNPWIETISVWLDCGAYKARKRKKVIDFDAFFELAHSRPFEIVICPDVIGDPEATWENWERAKQRGFHKSLPLVPTWGYGGPSDLLYRYLDEAPVVGIGGLVPFMREKDEKMLSAVMQLCRQFPRRLHVFGCSWLFAIEQLWETAYSGDSSKWCDAARYGNLIYVDERGSLSQASQRTLGLSYDMRTRLIVSAKNLVEYFKSPKVEAINVA